MKNKAEKLDASISNTGIGAILCFVLGFVLLEARMVQLGSRPIAHAIVVSVGTLITYVLYRTIASYRTAAAVRSNDTWATGHVEQSSTVTAAGAALLLMFGYSGALLLSNGAMTLFAIFVTCACTAPWSKIALCRTSILLPATLVTLANLPGVLTTDPPPHPLHVPMAVWMLWMGAVCTWLMNIIYRRQQSQASRLLDHQTTEEPVDAMKA